MAKCSTNMSSPVNLDSIMGEINSIGNRLELYGLDYCHMNTEIYRTGLRLQELYNKYKQFQQETERRKEVQTDMFAGTEKIDSVPRLTKKEYESMQRLEGNS